MRARPLFFFLTLTASSVSGAASPVGGSELPKALGVGRRLSLGSKATDPRKTVVVRPLTIGSQAVSPGSAAVKLKTVRAARPTTVATKAVKATAYSLPNYVAPIVGKLPKLSSQAPGLLLLLLDDSGSMSGRFGYSSNVHKEHAAADAVNNTIEHFIQANNYGGQVKDRLDVGVFTYTGGGAIASLSRLAANPKELLDALDQEGNWVTKPIRVRPTSDAGDTLMRRGVRTLGDAANGWRRRPQGDHLVLAVHVTDGESTDGDPRPQVAALSASVAAKGGKLLMTNIHVSGEDGNATPLLFPTDKDAAKFDQYGRMLFEMSSLVPPEIAAKLGTEPGARMMALNAGVEELARVFEAGSTAAAQ